MVRPPPAALPAVLSWASVTAAAWLDPTHDPLRHYVSWLSDGPFWWLGALGICAFATACVLVALRLWRVLPTRWSRQAAATLLACAAVMALTTLVLPSRGLHEPEWRTAVHVGLAVGGYAGVAGAALLLAWLHRLGRIVGPHLGAWAVVLLAALALVGLASAVVRLGDGPDLRGLAQLGLLSAAVAWLVAAERARAPDP